jgi:hypothetical protein
MVGDATCDGNCKDSLHDWRESEMSADSRNNSVAGTNRCFRCHGHRGNGDEPCPDCQEPSAGSSDVTKVSKSSDSDKVVRGNRRMTWTATLGESESSGVEFHGPGRRLTRCTSLVERPSHRRASLPDICKVVRPIGRGDDVQAGPGTAGSSSEAGSQAAGRRVSNESTFSIRRTESDPSSQRTDRCKSPSSPVDGLQGDGDPIALSGTFAMGGGTDGNRSLNACGSPLLGALSHLRKKDNRGNPNASSGWPVSVSPSWGSFSMLAGNESAGRKHIPKISSNISGLEDEGNEVERASRSSHPNLIPSVSSPCPVGSPSQWLGSWAGPKPQAVSDNPPGSVSADCNTGRDATTANWLGGEERWDALGISLINAKVIASGMLRENTEKISWAMEWTSPSAVLFTSIPLDAMHTRWQFSLLLWVKGEPPAKQSTYTCRFPRSQLPYVARPMLPASAYQGKFQETRVGFRVWGLGFRVCVPEEVPANQNRISRSTSLLPQTLNPVCTLNRQMRAQPFTFATTRVAPLRLCTRGLRFPSLSSGGISAKRVESAVPTGSDHLPSPFRWLDVGFPRQSTVSSGKPREGMEACRLQSRRLLRVSRSAPGRLRLLLTRLQTVILGPSRRGGVQ